MLPKLVRDKIPEIITQNQQKPNYYIADIEEYRERLFNKMKEELEETLIPDTPDDTKFNSDLLACYNNAKKNLPDFGFGKTAPPWIISCMLRKGYSVKDVTKEVIQRRFF